MRDDKRRIALEAIAYGDNTPPEARLRAIDALRALDDEPERRDFWTELEAMDDAELDRLYDGLASDTEIEAIAAGTSTRWPLLAERFRQAVETRARQLSNRDEIEREIEQRASELAYRRYVARGIAALEGSQAAPDTLDAPSAGDSSCPRGEAPRTPPSAPPPGIDLERGWHREEPSAVRWRPRTRPIPFLPPPS